MRCAVCLNIHLALPAIECPRYPCYPIFSILPVSYKPGAPVGTMPAVKRGQAWLASRGALSNSDMFLWGNDDSATCCVVEATLVLLDVVAGTSTNQAHRLLPCRP